MRVVLLGPPGVGKGTQAQLLSQWLQIPKISTGDMLRAGIAKGTDLGLKAQTYMDQGQLVPDTLIVRMVQQRITADDCQDGCVLDGFPRTVAQALALQGMGIELDWVLALHLADDVIVRRMSGRRIHLGSGRVYHLEHQPPQRAGLDDITGEALVQRIDDQPETVCGRLEVYHRQTAPLITHYRDQAGQNSLLNFKVIDGAGEIDQVQERLRACWAK